MKLTKGDKVLVVVLIIFSITFAFLIPKLTIKNETLYVSIQVNGEEVNKINFTDKKRGETLVVETEFGRNVLEFNDDEVRIIEASCLDKLCIKQGSIGKEGQLLVCLPNRLVVEIKSETPNNGIIDNLAF